MSSLRQPSGLRFIMWSSAWLLLLLSSWNSSPPSSKSRFAVQASSNLRSSSSSGSRNSRGEESKVGVSMAGLTPNPYVLASPLVVAAVASDGVVIVAVHTAFDTEPLLLSEAEARDEAAAAAEKEKETVAKKIKNDESEDVVVEPLPESDSNITTDNNSTNSTTADEQSTTRILKDIPESYRGPFRIYTIDGVGTALVCAGWRADGRIMAEYCRSVASNELHMFGPPLDLSIYGDILATETSIWMARCIASKQVRELNCVGLLACCGEPGGPGYVWLVDAVGAFRVPSHALGGGGVVTGGEGVGNSNLTSAIHEYLDDLNPVDDIPCDTLCRQLVQFISKREEIPSGTRLELAKVHWDKATDKPRMERLFVSTLFGVSRSTTNT